VSRGEKQMNKSGKMSSFGLIIGAVVLVLVGLTLITSVANTKATQTNLLNTINENNAIPSGCYVGGQVNELSDTCNVTVNNWYPTGDWRIGNSQCYLKDVKVSNAAGTPLVLDTDYKIYDSKGVIKLLNTTNTESANLGGSVLVNYSYCGEGYLTNSGDRSLANLWTLVLIVVLVSALAGVAMKVFNGAK